MKVTKIVKIFLLLLMIVFIIFGAFFLYMPRSMQDAKQRAIDEFAYYCTDNRVDMSLFIGPKLILDDEQRRIFEWVASGRDGEAHLFVRVPNSKLGEFTFGLLGQDVTLGETGGSSSQFVDTL